MSGGMPFVKTRILVVGVSQKEGHLPPETSSEEIFFFKIWSCNKKGNPASLSPELLATDQKPPFQDVISAHISSTSAQHTTALSGADAQRGAEKPRTGYENQENPHFQ